MDFLEWAKDVVATDLLTEKITYHEIFYASIANTAKLEHEKKNVFLNPLKVANHLS